MSDAGEKKENPLKKKISEKWGKSVTLRGFSQIPYYLLHINRFLSEEKKLSSLELLIIIQLTSNWWDKKENPYPSMINIADRCNVSERQIQRAINKIEEKGFIKREKMLSESGVIQRNSYDMNPLVDILIEISKSHPRIG